MADDYIGKKMEDYRRGITSSGYRRRLTPTGARAGVWEVKFPPRRVFVANGTDGRREADVIRELRRAGCRVAFNGSDLKAGRQLAEATGARFYPMENAVQALRRVAGTLDGIDVIVAGPDAMELAAEAAPSGGGRIILLADSLPECVLTDGSVTVNCISGTGNPGALVTFLCSPAADGITGQVIRCG